MEVGSAEDEKLELGWSLVAEMSPAEMERQHCVELSYHVLCASLRVQGADLAGDTFKTTVNVQLSPIAGACVGVCGGAGCAMRCAASTNAL